MLYRLSDSRIELLKTAFPVYFLRYANCKAFQSLLLPQLNIPTDYTISLELSKFVDEISIFSIKFMAVIGFRVKKYIFYELER